VHIKSLKLYYIHSKPATCFGRTCDHPQGGALRRIYYKSFWTNVQVQDTKFWNVWFKFKVCKSVHHRTIQINHQPDATLFQFIMLTFIYSSTCFGCPHGYHPELNNCSSSIWFYLRIVVTDVLCSWSVRPRTQHVCHHDTKVKPEAATAVIELLMTGGRTPETCWAVNKRQDNKLEKCGLNLQ